VSWDEARVNSRFQNTRWAAITLAAVGLLGGCNRQASECSVHVDADGGAHMACPGSESVDYPSTTRDAGRGCTVSNGDAATLLDCEGLPPVLLPGPDAGPVGCSVETVDGLAWLVCPDGTRMALGTADGGAPALTVTITGRIEGIAGGSVEGATVTVVETGAVAPADTGGMFVLEGVTLGNHALLFQAPDHQPQHVQVSALPRVTHVPTVVMRVAKLLADTEGLYPAAATPDGRHVVMAYSRGGVGALWSWDAPSTQLTLLDESARSPSMVQPDWAWFGEPASVDPTGAANVVLHQFSTGPLGIPTQPHRMAVFLQAQQVVKMLDLATGVTLERTAPPGLAFQWLGVAGSRAVYQLENQVFSWTFDTDTTTSWTLPFPADALVPLADGDRALAYVPGGGFNPDVYFLSANNRVTRVGQNGGNQFEPDSRAVSRDRMHALWREMPNYAQPGPVRHLDVASGNVTTLLSLGRLLGPLVLGETHVLVVDASATGGDRVLMFPLVGGAPTPVFSDVTVWMVDRSADGRKVVVYSRSTAETYGPMRATLVDLETGAAHPLPDALLACDAGTATFAADGSVVLMRK
jgi:hypothetical protein